MSGGPARVRAGSSCGGLPAAGPQGRRIGCGRGGGRPDGNGRAGAASSATGVRVVSVEGASAVRLVAVRDEPLSVDEVLAAVNDPVAGGVCVFVGTVRDHDHGREVTALAY